MEEEYAKGDESMKPALACYTAVVNAWEQSGEKESKQKIEELTKRRTFHLKLLKHHYVQGRLTTQRRQPSERVGLGENAIRESNCVSTRDSLFATNVSVVFIGYGNPHLAGAMSMIFSNKK
eukprot:1433927-Ditylum_brightwellii.AAC.1